MTSKSIDASPSEMILREDLLKLMPIVNGSNRMAAELKKGVDYELVLAPPGLKVIFSYRRLCVETCQTFRVTTMALPMYG